MTAAILFFQLTHPRFEVDAALGRLRITDVHLSDKGNYACVVNTTGQTPVTSTNAHLYVTSEYAHALHVYVTRHVYVTKPVCYTLHSFHVCITVTFTLTELDFHVECV